jgi:hypothetical protein
MFRRGTFQKLHQLELPPDLPLNLFFKVKDLTEYLGHLEQEWNPRRSVHLG